ncbi:MurR/RpiR family transcriptional regulator [Enterococcus sp. LJL120]
MYLFQKIEDAAFKENDARRSIGEFLLENKDQLANLTMQEIAQRTFSSKPTLVRFAKYFGYSGWREFIYAFTHEVASLELSASDSVDPNLPFDENSETLEIIENIANLKIQSLQETVALFEEEDLNTAAALINQAENLVIYGASPNSYYGELFRRKLLSIQKKAFMARPSEMGLISHSLTPADCGLIISYSGNSPEKDPISSVKILKRNGVPIIGLTSGGQNYLRDYATVVLNISSREKLYSKITNFATEESIMIVLDVLYGKVFALDYQKNLAIKINNAKDLESERASNFKAMQEDF